MKPCNAKNLNLAPVKNSPWGTRVIFFCDIPVKIRQGERCIGKI